MHNKDRKTISASGKNNMMSEPSDSVGFRSDKKVEDFDIQVQNIIMNKMNIQASNSLDYFNDNPHDEADISNSDEDDRIEPERLTLEGNPVNDSFNSSPEPKPESDDSDREGDIDDEADIITVKQ